jgi:hypothetical protein
MALKNIILECQHRRVKLYYSGHNLKLAGPKSTITTDLIESIRKYKPEILSALQKVERCKEIVRISDSNTLTYDEALKLTAEASELWEQIPREMLPDLNEV